MFCFQCQEASKGIGCTVKGVCGKESDVANLQDTLLFVLKGVAALNSELRKAGLAEPKVNKVIFDGLFSTITNANFDKVAFSIRAARQSRSQRNRAANPRIGDLDCRNHRRI